MSSDLNIAAAIGMPSADPSHRQMLQQAWSSINHLVNVPSEQARFPVVLIFLRRYCIISKEVNQGDGARSGILI